MHGMCILQNPGTPGEETNTENSKRNSNSFASPAGFGGSRESAGSSVLAVSVVSLSKHFYFNILYLL